MQYRFLGPTGIKVSVISYGNWVNSNSKEAQDLTTNCVKQAWDLGINFFDTAEVYGTYSFIQVMEKQKNKLELPSTLLVFQGITLWFLPNYFGVNQSPFPTLEDSQENI